MPRHFLKPGDLIFTPVEAAGLLGRAAKRMGLRYVHVAIYDEEDGKRYAIEAVIPRVVRREITTERLEESHLAYVDCSDGARAGALTAAKTRVGELYSVTDVIMAFFNWLLCHVWRPAMTIRAEMCSGLVRWAYASQAVFLTQFEWPMPDEVWDSELVKLFEPLYGMLVYQMVPWGKQQEGGVTMEQLEGLGVRRGEATLVDVVMKGKDEAPSPSD